MVGLKPTSLYNRSHRRYGVVSVMLPSTELHPVRKRLLYQTYSVTSSSGSTWESRQSPHQSARNMPSKIYRIWSCLPPYCDPFVCSASSPIPWCRCRVRSKSQFIDPESGIIYSTRTRVIGISGTMHTADRQCACVCRSVRIIRTCISVCRWTPWHANTI